MPLKGCITCEEFSSDFIDVWREVCWDAGVLAVTKITELVNIKLY